MTDSRIQLDDMLGPAFFNFMEIKDPAADFPLPESPETLQDFLRSKAGETFLQGLNVLLNKLLSWAKQHHLEKAQSRFADFKKRYLAYTGLNKDENEVIFTLYKSLPELAAFEKLLGEEKIPLHIRQNVFNEMIVNECAPGAHTNISKAYWKLAGYLNIALEWMMLRRDIAEQIVLYKLSQNKEELKQWDDYIVNKEPHYVNLILNENYQLLKIRFLEDKYIAFCHPKIGDILRGHFNDEIPKQLTAHAVIENIIEELDLMHLPEKLMRNYGEGNERFRQTLKRYGSDKNFSIYQLIVYENDEVRLKWEARYVLYLNIFFRLIQSRYFSAAHLEQTYFLQFSQSVVHYFTSHPFKMAYVRYQGRQQPFIFWCIDVLTSGNAPQVMQLLKFVLSDQISDEQRFEILEGFLVYIKATLTAPANQTRDLNLWMKGCVFTIHTLLPNGYRFDFVLNNLPAAAQIQFLQQLGWSELLRLIATPEQLANVVICLPERFISKLLRGLGVRKLQELIKNSDQLAQVLKALPCEKWDELFNLLGPRWEFDIRPGIHSQLLAVIFSRLPAEKWQSFMQKYLHSDWRQCFSLMFQLIGVLNDLPEEKWPLFFGVQGLQITEIWHRIIEDKFLFIELNELTKQKFILFLRYVQPFLIKSVVGKRNFLLFVLQSLSLDKMPLFLKCVGITHLSKILNSSYCHELGCILEYLNKDKINLLLNHLGAEKLRSIIGTRVDLRNVLPYLSKEKLISFLDFLGIENLQIMIHDKTNWRTFLSELSKHTRIEFNNWLINALQQKVRRTKSLAILHDFPDKVKEAVLALFTDEEKTNLQPMYLAAGTNAIGLWSKASSKKVEEYKTDRKLKPS